MKIFGPLCSMSKQIYKYPDRKVVCHSSSSCATSIFQIRYISSISHSLATKFSIPFMMRQKKVNRQKQECAMITMGSNVDFFVHIMYYLFYEYLRQYNSMAVVSQ